MNVTTHTFTPFWLSGLDQHEQDDVRQWLTDAGMNVNLCPGFDYDGMRITTRYYAVNDDGQAMWDKDTGAPIYEDQVREFTTTRVVPDAVHSMLMRVRGG